MTVIKHIVYWMLVLSGSAWLAARLNRKKILVLAYHGVYAGPADPRLNFDGMHVRADRFTRQMRYIARRYRVTTLDALLDDAPAGQPPAVITLDDGYRNVDRVAHPILKSLGLPATFFVTTDFVATRRGFWWDRLRVMVAASDRWHVSVAIDGAERTLAIRTLAEQRTALAALSATLGRLAPATREATLRTLAARLGVSDRAEPGPLGTPVSRSDVRRLAGDGITIGSHCVTHDSLLVLGADAVAHELSESRRCLEEWTGRPVTWLAYPRGEWSAAVAEATRQVGYRGAVTTVERLNDTTADRYALRRIGVHDNMTFAHFIVAISGLRDLVLPALALLRRMLTRQRLAVAAPSSVGCAGQPR